MIKATALQALRRFWWIPLLLGCAGGLLSALPDPAETVDSRVFYVARHTLLIESDGGVLEDPTAVNQLELRATTGDVPDLVEERLGYPAALSSTALDTFEASLILEATADSPEVAEDTANAYADVLSTYVTQLQQNIQTDRRSALLTRSDQLQEDIDDLQDQLDPDVENAVVQAQLDALQREYSVVFEQLYNEQNSNEARLVLTTLERASARPVETSAGGLGAPTSRSGRAALGVFSGLALGSGLALLAGRLDRRVRSRAHAEYLFGAPASVIVPDMPELDSKVVVRPDRHDQLSDAYRTLRSVLTFSHAARVTDEEESTRAMIIVVVSPGSSDGKTSIASNLSAALVEANKRTLAVNTDFRRPTLSRRLLGEDPTPLPFDLSQLNDTPPSQLLRRTPLPNLVLLDLSTVAGPPGSLARSTTRLLEPLSNLVDAIVIDSSPVGATAEVLELLPFADHVVVSMRLDHTLTSAAQRSMSLLRALSTGEMHLVVVGESIERSPYYEYGNPTGKRTKRRQLTA
jgi:Mrp family chromosome partitioning ATPase